MTAVAILPLSILPAWAVGLILLVSIVSLVVVRKEFGRRTVVVALIGVALVGPVPVLAAEDDGVVIYSSCEGLTPWDALYWLRGCYDRN